MPQYTLNTRYKRLLADTLTPVSIYLKLRDKFANSILLESSDYHGNENSFSFICLEPIAQFKLQNGELYEQFPDGKERQNPLSGKTAIQALQDFADCFSVSRQLSGLPAGGLFGYSSFDAVRYFEDIQIQTFANDDRAIPDMYYQVYRFVIAINHFNNTLFLFDYRPEHLKPDERLHEIENIITRRNFADYHFTRQGKEQSNLQDMEYIEMVEQGIAHCQRGDVFQMVLSRQFSQRFTGDDFNVYRALRSVNPSPYLYYFDYGSFKIFGSSPEAQIKISEQKAEIHPIAGTFKRSGRDEEDAKIAQKLTEDEKENAEHVMLVDLARNDLSRNGQNVQVATYKEIQYYSHLIHLVSKVTAEIAPQQSGLALFADTFPAGTLSGAPKYKALELINRYENQNRGYYGGAIGFIGFRGEVNHAIMIRSFLSKHNQLYYQAGAGIVSKSNPQKELEEVNHKLGALRKAIENAEKI